MTFGYPGFNLKKAINYVDWKLLIFLILFLNIKLELKALAIIFIYAFQFNFKFGFKIKHSRLPLFYILIILIGFIGLIINKNYQDNNYMLVFFTGIGFWLLSILAIHQIKLIVEKTEAEKIHRTIIAFFIINAIISICTLAIIMLETGSINPYTYKEMHRVYFIMTGDYIKGISFDISSTNAVLSAFGVIYFLVKKMPVMLLICMCTLLLTYSNLISLMLLFVMLILFIFKSEKNQKSLIITCVMLFFIFMLKVSPQNKDYVIEVIKNTIHIKNKTLAIKIPATEQPGSLVNYEEKRKTIATHYLDSVDAKLNSIRSAKHSHSSQLFSYRNIPISDKGRIYIKGPDTNTAEHWLTKDISSDQKQLLDFISTHKASLPISSQKHYAAALPGKVTGLIQTILFLYNHPGKMPTGVGIGNFSSKIAFRAAGLGLRGHYPEKYVYINPAFLSNHFDLYMSYFSKGVSNRSVSNNPFSVYDQLLAEYGLPGLLVLFIFYFGFFSKHHIKLTYGIPLLIFVAGIFFIDYWFEQLSVMILFELMLFLNIKESENLIKKCCLI
jgi:hypothetical protein